LNNEEKISAGRLRRWLPIIPPLLLALAGYFGAWVPHRAAGLVIAGVDFAEVVKFIPEMQGGQISVLREAFYMPLVAASLTATFVAGRRRLPRWLRFVALMAAVPLALAMLPPAWSPGLLLQGEFRIQVLAIAFCLLAVPLIALTRLLPDGLVLLLAALLALAAAVWPTWSYLQVLPPLRALYETQALLIGWGFWLSVAGWLVTAFLALVVALHRPAPARRLV
jgi:hypothetical protein